LDLGLFPLKVKDTLLRNALRFLKLLLDSAKLISKRVAFDD
jgi:hypothetical protein